MNLNERLIAEKNEEIAALKAHVERLILSLEQVEKTEMVEKNYQWIECCAFCGSDIKGGHDEDCLRHVVNETPTQSLQEHDKQVILDAVEPVQHKFCKYLEAVQFTENQQKLVMMGAEAFRNILRSHANNLTNGDDNG